MGIGKYILAHLSKHLTLVQVQDLSFYYSITAPANANVSMLSVLLIIAGGLMISTCVCQIAATKHFNWEIETTKHKTDKIFMVLCCGEFVRMEIIMHTCIVFVSFYMYSGLFVYVFCPWSYYHLLLLVL